jgi:hypothetical protein
MMKETEIQVPAGRYVLEIQNQGPRTLTPDDRRNIITLSWIR